MSRLELVVMGNQSLLVQCTETALERGHLVKAVVTTDADIGNWAMGRGLRVEAPGGDLAGRLGGHDWLLSIANLMIIPEDVLACARHGAVNFHDGPLPRHAGLNAPIWAMLEGETRHGITWHLIEGGVDEGAILTQEPFEITPQDTALTLNTKAYEAALTSFPRLMTQLEQGPTPMPQDLTSRSYHGLTARPVGFGLLDLSLPATVLERQVRALDHGPYWNPLCAAKLQGRDALWLVGGARLIDSYAAPGTVVSVDDDSLTVACGAQALVLTGLTRMCGTPAAARDVANEADMLPLIGVDVLKAADAASARVTRTEAVTRRAFASFAPATLSEDGVGEDGGPEDAGSEGDLRIRPLVLSGDALTAVALWAKRLSGQDTVDLAYGDAGLTQAAETGLVAPWALLRAGPQGLDLDRARPFATDLFARAPELSWPQTPAIGVSQEGHVPGTAITLILADAPRFSFDTSRVSVVQAELLAARLELWSAAPDEGLPEAERAQLIDAANDTTTPHDRSLTMQAAFEAQVARTPEATALIFENQRLTYAEVNARANQQAHLLREMGVAPGRVVGLCLSRSPDLLIGALAVLKAGGAYLPMDPSYPADRLQHFVEDSGAGVILTQTALRDHLPSHRAQVLVLDAEPRLAAMPDSSPGETSAPEDLAYLIYTSGSTGKPKGVMIEHRNVLNFYTGMDAHIPAQGTWLAVTSLSFDISVLELFWTTARGMTVVLTGDEDRGLISNGPLPTKGGMDYSIYYWGNDDGVGRDKYNLLLEGAKFADQNGFCAVWTPERHFHAFGGPYPNPSVTGAAVAAVTQNIAVRAGSVVAPLHHPARIAEEWAVIDNLTNGRAGMAFASGWQPDDFILRPENTPPENKPAMMRDLETVRKLWRGEAVGFPRKDGALHEVVTQPRPVSKELPVWVTTAGNPKTWEEAGRNGCNVLTHLLGQSVEEVGGKIKLYHAALREAGHDPKDFSVTLMLHTYIAASREEARDIARGPMKDYLNSAAGLIKQYAWAFPAFKRPEGASNAFDLQLDGLEPEELDAILDFAFERYFNDSGLFGTVEDALARTEQVKAIGVTEIACLIDYGIPREMVLDGFVPLAEVVREANATKELAEDDFSIAAQIMRHDVTHLQCTPSMARMIAMNTEARQALAQVEHLYFGGEPLPGALVREFAEITDASVTNMYGPTETTIWSSCSRATSGEGVMPIGAPLANQQLYILDEEGAPVGFGQEGELWIGGEGVTRGYHGRPDLTEARFVPNPFHAGRMYRTGDLVRRRFGGSIDFIGRVDTQVKLRGYRIELGEIEGALEAQAGVTQAVVLAREDVPGDVRLVGYYTGEARSEADLKAALREGLPAFMVPGRFVHLKSFPLTPNKKVDGKALPKPQSAAPAARPDVATAPEAPAVPQVAAPAPVAIAPAAVATGTPAPVDVSKIEAQVAAIWERFLGVAKPRPSDNFFDLGGHSLLAVQVHRALREELGAAKLSITDIFRLPVLADLSERLAGMVSAKPAAPAQVAPVSPPAAPTPVAAPPVPAAPVAVVQTPVATAPVGSRAHARQEAMARRRAMRASR